MRLGPELIAMLESARQEVLIVAPFIKRHALGRILESIPDGVSVTVFTRFLASDIAAGVTDKEIVSDIHEHPQAKIFMHPALHAKLYRADEGALVGSANVTGKALGWSNRPNLELLVRLNRSEHAELKRFELFLQETSLPLTDELAEAIAANASAIEVSAADPEELFEGDLEGGMWIPECVRPEILWEVREEDDANVTRGVLEAARRDISSLRLPRGLSADSFQAITRAMFLASPFYEALSEKLSGETGMADIEAARWLKQSFPGKLPGEAEDTWAVIKNWLRQYGRGVLIEAEGERTRFAERIGR